MGCCIVVGTFIFLVIKLSRGNIKKKKPLYIGGVNKDIAIHAYMYNLPSKKATHSKV